MKLVDVNKMLQKMFIGSYSLIVDREQKKILVHTNRYFKNFMYMNFEVVCMNDSVGNSIDNFSFSDVVDL